MKKSFKLLFCLLMFSCDPASSSDDKAKLVKEVIDVEHDFAQMAADSGIENAFINYAAPDAVLQRGNRLVAGYDSIVAYMKGQSQAGVKLTWEPDFADVSASGDLAYTYGKYRVTFPDTAGNIQTKEGIFHTVWKLQPDGNWKFVWD